MRSFDYYIVVEHPELGKVRTIRGATAEEVEQKARAQMIAWDEQYARKLEAAARQAKRQETELSKAKALELTRDYARARDRLENILRETLAIDDTIDWDALLDRRSFDEPEPEPPPGPVLPPEPEPPPFRPSFWARWSSRARRRARERWEQTVAAQRAVWHEECERIRRDHESALDKWRSERAAWLERKMEFLERQTARNAAIEAQKIRYMNKDPDAVAEYCDMVLSRSDYPPEITKDFHVDYDPERGTLVVDYVPPSEDTLPMIREVKYVPSREEFESKPLGKREADRFYNRVICSIALRTLHELFEADRADALKDCVFNGFVDFVDHRDGRKKKTCILTVRAEKSRFAAIDLANVDPCECVHSLGALCAPNLRDRIPVKPMLQLSRDDPRFVPELDLGERIEAGMNVAALGWEEFEHLVRMILEKEVAAGGGEVKITRASRDAGVDAVIFDPDPIRGGKIVVQAKRYTNTVGVSVVRDLYGTILNEGASKGILITTSRFGPDAYDFAKNKPIVLIDGNNLLYLLEKQGLKAKIDLDEAKRLGVGLHRFR